MANKYLHQVTALGAAPASGDLFHITDVSDTTDLAQGTSKSITYANLLSGISITESQISDLGSYITLTDLSVGSEATASGDGAISYSNSTGVFTYTPPTLAGLNGSIDDLSDVTLTSTATNDILRWNGSAFVNTDSPTLDALQFDLTAAETAAVGQLAWNSEDLTLDLGLDTNVTLQIGQEQLARIKAASAIRNGMAVYISGVTGGSDNLEATPFSANSASGVDELRFLGIATETLSTNDIGFVTTFGKVRGVDGTTYASGGIRDNADTESWSVGDILYASPNIAGTLTSVVPTSPDRQMPIAVVLKIPNENNVTLFVRAEHGYHLNELHDVLISGTPADNEVLAYDSASGNWINQTATEAGIAATGHTHSTSDIISGTFADARIAQSNVTQHQAALSITESQISDLGSYITASSTDNLTNKTFSDNITVAEIAPPSTPSTGFGTIYAKTDGKLYFKNDAGTETDLTAGAGAGSGSVTSVDMSVPTGFAISGNPITTSGTLALAFDTGYSLPSNATQATWITASSTDTLTNKTFDANGTGNSLSNVETADIASGSKSGSDTTLITGTAGTDGNVVTWNADGDAVDSGYAVSAFVGGVNYQGTWNASTNSPTIPAASSSNKGYYYKVSVAGSTSIDGETDWKVGDWIISNGTTWDKVDNTESVSSVFGRTGAVTASFSDISGTATHEQGGLEADVSAYSGLIKISGGATSAITDNSSDWDTAFGWGDHSLEGYLTNIDGESISSLADVTITSIASGEILKWSGTAWINNTLAEAGIAATGHTHAASDITSGTFDDARIAETNVTQHQEALSITEAQISDLGSYITASSTDTLTNKTFDANGTGNSLSNVETADIASGSKTGSDTTLVTGTAGTNGNLVSWNADGDAVDSSIVATNVALTDGDTYTGTHDFGGATLEIPNAAAPSLSVAGQIALDTSTTDHTALLKYHDGTNEFVIPAILSSGLSTTDNDVIAYNAANNRFEMEAQSGAGGGISNVVEDTTPQLGGQLDVNGNAIGDGTRELLTFTEDASAVNHVNIENEATGSGPIISAAGDDTNIDLNLSAKGTGDISLGTIVFDADQTIGAGQDNYVLTYDNATGKISLEAAAGGGGTVTSVDMSVPTGFAISGNPITSSGTLALAFDTGYSLPSDATQATWITASSTTTFTNKTFDANGTGNSLSNVETADIASGSKTGSDTTLVTGTAGTNGNLVSWNADGDAVDSSVVAANVITTSNTASTSASGIVELATAAETTLGTDTGRAVTPDGLAGSDFGKTVVTILVSDPNGDAITAGNGKAYWRVPSTINGYNLVDVEMAVTTASTSGNPTVQIHNVTDTADMLSTSLTIDANETDSSTAATAAVINTSTDDVATADMLRIDIDAAGTGTKGLMVELTFQLP